VALDLNKPIASAKDCHLHLGAASASAEIVIGVEAHLATVVWLMRGGPFICAPRLLPIPNRVERGGRLSFVQAAVGPFLHSAKKTAPISEGGPRKMTDRALAGCTQGPATNSKAAGYHPTACLMSDQ
jgi:hypothetical protein